MKAGVLHQFDTAEGIYDRPATRFVADFTAMTNVLEGRLEAERFLVDGIGAFPAAPGMHPGDLLGLRPEALDLVEKDDSRALVEAEVKFVAMTGGSASVELGFGEARLKVVVPRLPMLPKAGERVGVALSDRGRPVRVPA